MDIATGARAIVADSETGSGVPISAPHALAYDAAGNRALISRPSIGAIIGVDLTTGVRTIVSDDTTGSGPPLRIVLSMAVDATNQRLLVSNRYSELLSVDLATGNRSLIATGDWNSSQSLFHSHSLMFDEVNNRVFVLSNDEDAILSIDLATAAISVVSDPSTGSGPAINWAASFAVDMSSNRGFVADPANELILSVDLATGDRTVFSKISVGDGIGPIRPQSMYLDEDENRLVVWDGMTSGLVGVDLTTGARSSLITVDGTPLDLAISEIASIGNRIFGTYLGFGPYLIELDIASGQVVTLSDTDIGMGPDFHNVDSLAGDPAGHRVLLGTSHEIEEEEYEGSLVWVDLATGDRTVMADNSTGAGLLEPQSIVLDADQNRVLVMDSDFFRETLRLVSVDMTTGSTTVISSADVGSGPPLDEHAATGMRYDRDNNRVYVALIFEQNAIIAIDLATGDRTSVSSPSAIGSGPWFDNIRGLEMPASGDFIYVGDHGHSGVFAVDTRTGDRVIISR